jgi:hypothetical protein
MTAMWLNKNIKIYVSLLTHGFVNSCFKMRSQFYSEKLSACSCLDYKARLFYSRRNKVEHRLRVCMVIYCTVVL